MLRHGVNKWQTVGVQPGVEESLLSRAVDEGTAAAIVLKWQQYLAREGIASSEANQNHENAFITHFANDLDSMLTRYTGSPQMAKSLVHNIIGNWKKGAEAKKLMPMNQIDETSEDLSTQDQFAHFTQSDSTADFATMERQRGGSISSASTNVTSKYDHLASILRMDIVKHSFYGSPEREYSPPISQSVSELPSPETSEISRKIIYSIDEVDSEFLQESEKSTLEILEWSNGLNDFRKAAPHSEIDHAAHDFRFLHPMNKQLFPPAAPVTFHQPLRTSSPVRPVSSSGKVCPSPHHSPSHVILPTIVESASESVAAEPSTAILAETAQASESLLEDELRESRAHVYGHIESSEQVTEVLPVTEGIPSAAAAPPTTHSIVFPDVVYEPAHPSKPELAHEIAVHRDVDLETDAVSVGSSLSAASTSSTVYSGRRVFSLATSADMMRRQMVRKLKSAKNKKRKDKLNNRDKQDGLDKPQELTIGREARAIPATVVEMATQASAPPSPVCETSVSLSSPPHQEHKHGMIFGGEDASPMLPSKIEPPASSSAPVTPARDYNPAADAVKGLSPMRPRDVSPVPSPVRTIALRHKAENELTVSVVRFLFPFFICVILYVSGRYYYKTQSNIWQNQTPLHGVRPKHFSPPVPMQPTTHVQFDATEPVRRQNQYGTKPPPAAVPPTAAQQQHSSRLAPPTPPATDESGDMDGNLSLHVSIRGLDGHKYSEHRRSGRGRAVASIYSGKFGAFRQAWVRIKGVFFAAARTVVAPVQGLLSIFR